MSVALRGSPRGSLGTLRRTASLEFFLDMDKECAVEEVELDTPPPRPLVGVALSAPPELPGLMGEGSGDLMSP